MAKRVVARPELLHADQVQDIYSISSCISRDFADYIPFWKHNGFWFFDSPEIIEQVAQENSLDLQGMQLFYYEVLELEYNRERGRWQSFMADTSFPTHPLVPPVKELAGYDVVTFFSGNKAEHSPLSCNYLASEIETNAHCLLDSQPEAVRLLESGAFKGSEPGPLRVFAVYTVEW